MNARGIITYMHRERRSGSADYATITIDLTKHTNFEFPGAEVVVHTGACAATIKGELEQERDELRRANERLEQRIASQSALIATLQMNLETSERIRAQHVRAQYAATPRAIVVDTVAVTLGGVEIGRVIENNPAAKAPEPEQPSKKSRTAALDVEEK